MTQVDAERFSIAILALGEALGEQVSEPRLKAYFAALSDLSIEQVEEAAGRLLRTARFFPKPVDFREAVQLSTQDRAELAWRTFSRLCVEEGVYPSLQVADSALGFAISQFGGWQESARRIADSSAEMLRAHENQFKTSYRLGLNRSGDAAYFAGYYESQNRQGIGRMDRATGGEILLDVCLVETDNYIRLRMPFDLNTGRLTDSSRAALEAGGVAAQAYIPAPARLQLSAASDSESVEVDQAAVLAQIRQLTDAKGMPAAGSEGGD